jgi:glutamate N-acetyltransferase / amino-acid N-acetyltransferase
VLINAGCSNAATGEQGVEDARSTMRAVAQALTCQPEEIMPSSTGIIGHRLPVEKITSKVGALVSALGRGHGADDAAAAAIMTTDLVPKQAHREIEIFRHQIHLGAIAKGSGMIAPRLDAMGIPPAPQGTMLAFVTTDATVEWHALQHALEHASRESFDRVSVDAHPSCSDTIVCMASGAASSRAIHEHSPEFHVFQSALTSLCQELAMKVVRDGEGATRVFRVTVRGAASTSAAERIARAIVDSPLVKCAIHGRDPNWGRIVTAAGNAGIAFDPAQTSLSIGGIEVYRAGMPTGVARNDQALKAAMDSPEVDIVLLVGGGIGGAWMMGCDLSAKYVSINADYTT